MSGRLSSPAPRKPGRWSDLGTRSLSALVLLGLGGVSIYLGGLAFVTFVAVCIGAVFWETLRMYRGDLSLSALGCGLVAALAVLLASYLPLLPALLALLVPVGLGAGVLWAGVLAERRRSFVAVGLWLVCAAYGLIWLRHSHAVSWTFWLIFVIVATDVAGYFVGKHFGGRKLWPAVSPNKTWSGTSGGWVAAAVIGALFALLTSMSAGIIAISVFVAMASQAGDIAESALKRRLGVKDSSQLIPGHGGVFDRFDGMLGAGALCFLLALTWG